MSAPLFVTSRPSLAARFTTDLYTFFNVLNVFVLLVKHYVKEESKLCSTTALEDGTDREFRNVGIH